MAYKPITAVDKATSTTSLTKGDSNVHEGLFSSKIFQDFLSHQIFKRMHKALNIDKKIKLIT
jgi:hypothetical protein